MKIPVAECGGNPVYIDRLQSPMTSRKQRRGLNWLLGGLRRENARCDEGMSKKPVWVHSQAARWVLEQIADQLPEEENADG